MHASERAAFLSRLERMPAELRAVAARLGPERSRRAGAAGAFSLLEHAWHLADLEREGFGVRIRRLRDEDSPALPDFDGAAIAAERRYATLDLEMGLAAFEAARRENLAALRALAEGAWTRAGSQDGVGAVTLGDLPRRMAEHDAAHAGEIVALRAELAVASLAAAPVNLAAALAGIPDAALRRPPAEPPPKVEALSAVGHARHLGDIELEGYHDRIARTRSEDNPFLANLPGVQMAIDRKYDAADVDAAVATFASARERTLRMLASVRPEEWLRPAFFEGVGPVTLLELVEILAEHDAGHLRALGALPR